MEEGRRVESGALLRDKWNLVAVAARAVDSVVLLVAISVVAVAVALVMRQGTEDALNDTVVACLDRHLYSVVLSVHEANLAVRTMKDPAIVSKGERAQRQQTGSGGRHHNSSLFQHSDYSCSSAASLDNRHGCQR